MKAMLLAFATIVLMAVVASEALKNSGYSTEEQTSSAFVRLD